MELINTIHCYSNEMQGLHNKKNDNSKLISLFIKFILSIISLSPILSLNYLTFS